MTDLRQNHKQAVWNLPSAAANGVFQTSLCIPKAHDNYPIYGVDFVDATTIFTCGADHKLKRWDLRMAPFKAKSAEYLGHSAPLRSLAVAPDKRFVVTGCEDGSCRIWRGNELGDVNASRKLVKGQLDKRPEDQELLRQHRVLSARSEQIARNGYGSASVTLTGHVSLVSACAWLEENDKASVLSCSWDQSINLYEVALKNLA
jgi:WD40 repeat protein